MNLIKSIHQEKDDIETIHNTNESKRGINQREKQKREK